MSKQASKTFEQIVEAYKGKMKYTQLGTSGLRVSKICLGCMGFGSSKWQFFTGDPATWVLDEEEALPVIKAAYDVGINFFDTANSYSHGESEKILGKAIKKYGFPRDEIVVATKVFGTVARDVEEKIAFSSPDELAQKHYSNRGGLSRKSIFDAVDACLKRLDLEYIDLLQIHRFDSKVKVEETMRALNDLVTMGKVRYIGASSMYAWQFTEMQYVARMNGWTEFITMQNYYNAAYREEEREMMPCITKFGVASIPWSPLGAGMLTRPIDTQKEELTTRGEWMAERFHQADIQVTNAVQAVAEKLGVPMARVALAWVLRNPAVSAPILGVTKPRSLEDACAGLDLQLSDEDFKSISDAYVVRGIFGH